ncbi:hypothetical protein O181_064920 [Austropuccinia psidii MF-1]|uniref:Uncharacterized protein n=1 Tax=Austropuccinia psidii MF-1 TaxID=1389203 RepID=A0A9Q3I3L6_9BASI|nr:hypothetical protein [Austropuccinia psidii MF-1]
MYQHSTSKLSPLPKYTVEVHYEEKVEEEDSPVTIQSFMKKMQEFKHIRPEDSLILPTPGPMENSTQETYPRIQIIPRRVFVSTPNNPSPLQQQVLRQETLVAKIEAKDNDLKFNEEEVETLVKKVERIAQINGKKYEDLAMGMAFWTTGPRVSEAIEAIPGYGELTQLKKSLIAEWGIA